MVNKNQGSFSRNAILRNKRTYSLEIDDWVPLKSRVTVFMLFTGFICYNVDVDVENCHVVEVSEFVQILTASFFGNDIC